MSKRSNERIDYKVLHNTGEKLSKEVEKESISPRVKEISNLLTNLSINERIGTNSMDQLIADQLTLAEDIKDLIDENPVDDINLSNEIEVNLTRIEQLRSQYRNIHIQLEIQLNDDYKDTHRGTKEQLLLEIKQYIKELKNKKRSIHHRKCYDEQNQLYVKQKSIDFLISELDHSIKELQLEYNKDLTVIDNNEIKYMKSNISEQNKKIQNVSRCIKELIENSTQEYNDIIDRFSKEYKDLAKEKELYIFSIESEIQKRDLNKLESFNESCLNIKLPKFKGYDSTMDIFTFQSNFEKLYKTRTPKSMLPDLLINNYLEDPALSLVKNVKDISDIWSRLKSCYGNPKSMLKKKLFHINHIESLSKIKDPEKIMEAITKIINLMKDLLTLATEHNIENQLYYGDSIEKIYDLLGDDRVTRWLMKTHDEKLKEREFWEALIEFLERELRVQQERCLIQGSKSNNDLKDDKTFNRKYKIHYQDYGPSSKCYICDGDDHCATNGPNNLKLIQYFSCKDFVEMTPKQRFNELKSKDLCVQCLFPGANQEYGKHKEGKCQRDFICQHPSHQKYSVKKHVLVCDEHKDNHENEELLNSYKSKYILNRSNIPEFSKNIKLSFHISVDKQLKPKVYHDKISSDIHESSIYILQTINVDGKPYTLFFDSGCGDLVSRFQAIQSIDERASQEVQGPIELGGVGNLKTESKYGIYKVILPLYDGKNATMSGVCLDQITLTFPEYPLQGEVEHDLVQAFQKENNSNKQLPKLPRFVGGDTDFMIGIKYLRYYPEKIFELPTGLTIYESKFKNIDGSRGVIGGPHHVFTEIEKHFYGSTQQQKIFLSQQYSLFKAGYQLNPDIPLLGIKMNKDNLNNILIEDDETDEKINYHSFAIKQENLFNAAENAGSEILYRCIKCRECKNCKDNDHIDNISIKEEIEQELINESVKVDTKNRYAVAKLPFIHDPIKKLAQNKENALKVYFQQLKKLNKNDQDKIDVINAEKKLQILGHVEYLKDLPEDQRNNLTNNMVQNYIPWRSVWKESSISTPCRLVFDASQITNTGFSLNDIIAKGRNNMNRLVEILMRWMIHKIGLHTDVQKMYNSVKLRQEDWCYQRYIWQKDLDSSRIPEEKIIKTLIYGVRSSGNQAERAIRETAKLSSGEFPKACSTILDDIYVDDCISGGSSIEEALKLSDELEIILNRGGFSLKGFTFSGSPPHESLSHDGETINVAGLKWYPEIDEIALDISEINFSKKCRGKKPSEEINKIPEKLSRRHCVSKVSEIYDLTGLITPITASMKIDLHTLVKRKLKWDDIIPDDLRQIWKDNFEMIQELKNIRFQRAIIPKDAINLDIDTIDNGDASQDIACVAIYARFKRSNGEFSCQLIFSRSKLIPDLMSQPRAELYAAVLNTHTGEVVKKSLNEYHKKSLKLTDSQIALHWITNNDKVLKQWVRNRVIDIRRFTTKDQWMYVKSNDMIADIGTRKGAKIADVNQDSIWRNGFEWMKLDRSQFPIKSVKEIKLEKDQVNILKNEFISNYDSDNLLEFHWPSYNLHHTTNTINQDTEQQSISPEVLEIYKFSNYVIDPNRHRFQVVVRILAIVYRFIDILKNKIKNKLTNLNFCKDNLSKSTKIILSDDEIQRSQNYFYKLATKEIQKFAKPNQYDKISSLKDNILFYIGRILPNQEIELASNPTNVMLDLCPTSFCVPIIYKNSPIAYSIVNEIHWYHNIAKHSGIETVLRYVQKQAYIIEGRSLVKQFRKRCERCRYLIKRSINVAMGPLSNHNLTIAPPYFITQVDLAGPYKAYSPHNKRSTIKIWLVVFCCSTTSTTNIKVMDDYSSESFIQAFIRFSCEVGYPKILLLDEGSQLIKGSRDMKLNFRDIKYKLHCDKSIEFELCPVGGHNMHGRVERKIKEIKLSIEKNFENERISLLQWETISSEIANTLNDLPLALGNITSDFENMDLITPNRLRLGRNNERSPVGPMTVTNNSEKFLKINERIFNTWFECWLISHVPKLMQQPKWYNSDRDVKVGDVVLFLKNENPLSNTYQYGIISDVKYSKDGKIRKVTVRYRNSSENVDRYTNRAIRQLIIIHPVDELSIIEEMGNIAAFADMKFKLKN